MGCQPNFPQSLLQRDASVFVSRSHLPRSQATVRPTSRHIPTRWHHITVEGPFPLGCRLFCDFLDPPSRCRPTFHFQTLHVLESRSDLQRSHLTVRPSRRHIHTHWHPITLGGPFPLGCRLFLRFLLRVMSKVQLRAFVRIFLYARWVAHCSQKHFAMLCNKYLIEVDKALLTGTECALKHRAKRGHHHAVGQHFSLPLSSW